MGTGNNGAYTVSLNTDQVFDQSVNGLNAAAADALETFEVTVPNSAPDTMDASFTVSAEVVNGTVVDQVTVTNGSGAYAIGDDGTISVD